MKTLHLAITVIFVTALIVNTGMVLAQYGPGFSPVEHYPPVNDTALKLLVMNSTEFKERIIGYNYTLAGIDHNWISKGSNYYDFGGAKVTFFVFGFQNGTTKGDVFNIDSQMKIKNVFEYNADNPTAGYYTDRCMGCPLETGTKPKCCDPYVPIPIKTPLKQFKSGIGAKDVKCILGFELILKTENNSPACVELETAQKFVDRGWAKMIISNALNSGTIVTIPVNSSISTSGLTFSPSTTNVVIGVNNTVEWINMDGVMNDITSDTGFFKTSLIPHGHAWEYLFDKTGTYQYHSSSHPWLKGTVIVVENNTSSQQISNSDQQAKLLSENDCGQFYAVPENHTSLNTIPVLLMKTNSTACVKLTFTIISNYNDCNGPNCQHVLDVKPTDLMGNIHYEKHGDSFSITPGKNYDNSFKIVTIPDTVDLANYPVGTNYTVTYIIKPLANATGFYDQSIPRLACERYPLAVGYAADKVNASDFSYIDTLNPPCVSSVSLLTKVEVSGMDYKEVTLRLAVLEQTK